MTDNRYDVVQGVGCVIMIMSSMTRSIMTDICGYVIFDDVICDHVIYDYIVYDYVIKDYVISDYHVIIYIWTHHTKLEYKLKSAT